MTAALLAPAECVVVGRQPIFDADLDVVAYELLYRRGQDEHAAVVDNAGATRHVLSTALLEFGLSELVGDRDAYVNVCSEFLFEETLDGLPADRIVLEVLEHVVATEAIVERVAALKQAGFRIALDDFEWTDENAPLVELADIVKLDARLLGRDGMVRHAAKLKPYGVRLLAEKVEAYEDFERYRDLGFESFQGYFVCGPERCEGRRMSADKTRTLTLIAALNDPEVTPARIEQEIGTDPALACKLLRFVNSSACGISRRVESLKHAATLVGLRRLRTWAALVALGSFSSKPRELLVLANARARACEMWATLQKAANADSYFIVGLFSLLHAFADADLETVIGGLPLSDEVTAAILRGDNDMGHTLLSVIEAEQGRVPSFGDSAGSLYVDALRWADEAVAAIDDAA